MKIINIIVIILVICGVGWIAQDKIQKFAQDHFQHYLVPKDSVVVKRLEWEEQTALVRHYKETYKKLIETVSKQQDQPFKLQLENEGFENEAAPQKIE